jgi:transcriptional regulator NrdR family protein
MSFGGGGLPASDPDEGMECPFCGSTNTELERERGPGRCRRVHYCNDCEQPFEQFG